MSIDWKPLRAIIESNQRFVISSHVRPDADAIGSELAVASLLERMGKSVRIVNPSHAPDSLAFLDPERRVKKVGEGITLEEIADTDVHLVVDTSSWAQLQEIGHVLKRTTAVKAVIDHHASSDDLGGTQFKDQTAEATGVLIVEMCDALGYEITPEMAMPLYCAIVTDTGWFRFPSTKSATLRVAGRLIDLGVRPHVVYQALYEQASLARIRLAGCVLSRVTLDCGGRLAYTWVRQRDLAETGAAPADTEDLVNECLKIAGTQCAIIAVEQPTKTTKFSLRSRVDVNVAAIAEQFGGGGHKQAAGAVLPGPPDEALPKVLAAFRTALGC